MYMFPAVTPKHDKDKKNKYSLDENGGKLDREVEKSHITTT